MRLKLDCTNNIKRVTIGYETFRNYLNETYKK